MSSQKSLSKEVTAVLYGNGTETHPKEIRSYINVANGTILELIYEYGEWVVGSSLPLPDWPAISDESCIAACAWGQANGGENGRLYYCDTLGNLIEVALYQGQWQSSSKTFTDLKIPDGSSISVCVILDTAQAVVSINIFTQSIDMSIYQTTWTPASHWSEPRQIIEWSEMTSIASSRAPNTEADIDVYLQDADGYIHHWIYQESNGEWISKNRVALLPQRTRLSSTAWVAEERRIYASTNTSQIQEFALPSTNLDWTTGRTIEAGCDLSNSATVAIMNPDNFASIEIIYTSETNVNSVLFEYYWNAWRQGGLSHSFPPGRQQSEADHRTDEYKQARPNTRALSLTGIATRGTTQASGEQRESDSKFEAPAKHCMVGRYHWGDENANTKCYWGPFNYGSKELNFVNAAWGDWIKESSSHYVCPDGTVMVGREHYGDENRDTRYMYATPILLEDVRPVRVGGKTKSGEIKESRSDYMAPTPNCLTGRDHYGDENGGTWYYYSDLEIIAPQWMAYLPIYVQNKIDNDRYPVNKVFIEVRSDNSLLFWTVFTGEGVFDKTTASINTIATTLYNAFTYAAWQRTADVERFRIFFDSNWQPVRVSFSSYSGSQSMFAGDLTLKTVITAWCIALSTSFTLGLSQFFNITAAAVIDMIQAIPVYDDHIQSREFPWSSIQIDSETARPLIFVNTANHLFGPDDNNSTLEKVYVADYKNDYGNSDAANNYAKSLPVDANFVLAEQMKYLTWIFGR